MKLQMVICGGAFHTLNLTNKLKQTYKLKKKTVAHEIIWLDILILCSTVHTVEMWNMWNVIWRILHSAEDLNNEDKLTVSVFWPHL